MTENAKFCITPIDLHWIDSKSARSDLCAHGNIRVTLNDESLIDDVGPDGLSVGGHAMLDALLQYVRENNRVCPMPIYWLEVYDMLPNHGGDKPAVPLILGGWDSPALFKMLRLEEHIRYADIQGVLPEVDQYLRRLEERAWLHLGE
jgi:hypothetical protein